VSDVCSPDEEPAKSLYLKKQLPFPHQARTLRELERNRASGGHRAKPRDSSCRLSCSSLGHWDDGGKAWCPTYGPGDLHVGALDACFSSRLHLCDSNSTLGIPWMVACLSGDDRGNSRLNIRRYFLGEPLIWQVVAAAFLVIVGAVFLTEQRESPKPKAWLGAAFALITGVLWGFAETVPAKLALQAGMTPETLLLVFALSGALGMFALVPILRPRIPRRVERRGVLFVALSAVCGAFLGWLLWLHALNMAPASVISPIRGSTLLFAFVYSVLFLKERPTLRALVGIAFVSCGVLLVSLS